MYLKKGKKGIHPSWSSQLQIRNRESIFLFSWLLYMDFTFFLESTHMRAQYTDDDPKVLERECTKDYLIPDTDYVVKEGPFSSSL